MKLLILLGVVGMLAGCTTYDAGKEAFKSVKQDVNDQQLDVSVQVLCNDVAVGAVRRKWDGDFTTWAKFCGGSTIVVPDKE